MPEEPTQSGVSAPTPAIGELMARFPSSGRLLWIGVRPGRRLPMQPLDQVVATAGRGLEGDHYRTASEGARQVTLVQSEHLPVIGAVLEIQPPDPTLLRRNLVIAGVNLIALKGVRFQVGDVVLEGTGSCHPCSRMEEALGPGGYNAMRGHGGLKARIMEGGLMRVGDRVRVLGPSRP